MNFGTGHRQLRIREEPGIVRQGNTDGAGRHRRGEKTAHRGDEGGRAGRGRTRALRHVSHTGGHHGHRTGGGEISGDLVAPHHEAGGPVRILVGRGQGVIPRRATLKGQHHHTKTILLAPHVKGGNPRFGLGVAGEHNDATRTALPVTARHPGALGNHRLIALAVGLAVVFARGGTAAPVELEIEGAQREGQHRLSQRGGNLTRGRRRTARSRHHQLTPGGSLRKRRHGGGRGRAHRQRGGHHDQSHRSDDQLTKSGDHHLKPAARSASVTAGAMNCM